MESFQQLLPTVGGWIWALIVLITPATVATLAWEVKKSRDEYRRHKTDAEADAYNEAYSKLEEQYIEYNKLLLENADLGVYALQRDRDDLTEEEQARRKIVYEILFAILERAYLDRNKTPEIEKNQWPGWEIFARTCMKRPSCVKAWREWDTEGGYGADARFSKFIDGLISPPAKQSPIRAAPIAVGAAP